jgi:uncharacterized membrane protein YfcA
MNNRKLKLLIFLTNLYYTQGDNLNYLCANNCSSYLRYCPNQCNDELWECSQSLNCVHKDLFPISGIDYLLGVLIIITTMLSSIGGIGGGGLLLPVYMLIGSFGIDYSIPLTIITVAGTSFVKFSVFFQKKHNLSFKRDMIDYLLVMIIVPFDSSLSFVGYVLNVTSPLWFLTINIFIVLSIMTTKMFLRGIDLFKLEMNTEKKITYMDGIPLQELPVSLIYIDGLEIEIESSDYKLAISDYQGDEENDKYIYLFYTSIMFFGLALMSMIRNYFLSICSNEYWIYITCQIIVTTFIGLFVISKVLDINNDRINNNYHFLDTDIKYNHDNIFRIVGISIITGIISTFLGIGGGMIMTPILNSLGMLPEVVSATSSVTTFFSAIISMTQYMGGDLILPYYSIYFFITGAIGGFLGANLTRLIVEFLQNRFLVLMILSFLVAVSCLLLTGINIKKLINNENTVGFLNFCEI